MHQHAQGFQQAILIKPNEQEELKFPKRVEQIQKSKIPVNANIISSNTIYKIKSNDGESLSVKPALLQTGQAQIDVYVVNPLESRVRQNFWFLMPAAYGLLNENAKRQYQSHTAFKELGLTQLPVIPQLFYVTPND